MNIINLFYDLCSLLYLALYECIYLLESCILFGSLFYISLSLYYACVTEIWFLSLESLYINKDNKQLPLTDYFHHEYNKIWILLILSLVICFLLFLLAYFFSFSTIKDSEKLSEYECGFEPFDNATRHPFDVHFYIVGILFLIFDVEIALLFPWVLSLYGNNWFSFYIMITFLGLLTIGFFYEWHRGALVWPHQQFSTIFSDYRESLN